MDALIGHRSNKLLLRYPTMTNSIFICFLKIMVLLRRYHGTAKIKEYFIMREKNNLIRFKRLDHVSPRIPIHQHKIYGVIIHHLQ